ncbi:MAG: hypothetical protein GQ477_01130 [Nanohaloarchaea archaeon]|nr:hypothetical protein [Candidatus Nanohaloarchaea archaeon]
MSGDCASCSGVACSSTYGPPTTISPNSAESPSLPSILYSDIKTAGGLDAAIDIYGIENLAKDIYLDHSSNPEKIADSFNDTDMHGVDYLPDKIAGMIESSLGYDSNGEISIDSDIFYNNNLDSSDLLYTALHELAHREQLDYSKNMAHAFKEGDAEYYADEIINKYVENLDDLYNGSLNTRYTSDPTYNGCRSIVTDIYEAIGSGNAEGGRILFYDALEAHNGDYNIVLDSFESKLNDNGIGLTNIYNALDMLDRELKTGASDIYNDTQQTPQIPYQDIYSGTASQVPFGIPDINIPYFDSSLANPLLINRDDLKLLRDMNEVFERYLKNLQI